MGKPQMQIEPKSQAEPPAVVDADDARLKARLDRINEKTAARGEWPQLKIVHDENGAASVQLPDDTGNAVGLLEMAGTANIPFAEHIMGQIVNFAVASEPKPEKAGKVVNALMGAAHGMEPRDEAEAMLIAQMASTSALAVETLTRAAQAGQLDIHERLVNAATKLSRTYTTQLQALAKYRGKRTEQRVVVEYVNVEPGGQAAIGAFSAGGAGEGRKNGE